MRSVCSWCKKVLTEGPEPTSHGMCSECEISFREEAGMPDEKRHVCRCSRSIPEDSDGILKAHRVGKAHPGFPCISKAKRKVTFCTGPDEERTAAAEAKEKAEKARKEAEAFAAKAAEDMKKAEELIALAKELEGTTPKAAVVENAEAPQSN